MKNKLNIINVSLKNDITEILENEYEVSKSTVGGFSIEVTENTPHCYSSYIYGNEEGRDKDFETIENLLKDN